MRVTLKDYCTSKGYNIVSKVRTNTNGYKYVTLADRNDGGNSENLYLGQRYGEGIKDGDVLPINTLFVAETTNATGEVRFKLTDSEGKISDEKLKDYQSF